MLLNNADDDIVIVPYDRTWPAIYGEERELILSTRGTAVLEIEHIGSTAIPNQKAKPIIDMMAAVETLSSTKALLEQLNSLAYRVIETGMRDRIVLRKPSAGVVRFFHLHIVEISSWSHRKERIMRDYLCIHPGDVDAYGELKETLAAQYPDDSLEYTKAKTEFIQNLMNKACDDLALPRIDVWND